MRVKLRPIEEVQYFEPLDLPHVLIMVGGVHREALFTIYQHFINFHTYKLYEGSCRIELLYKVDLSFRFCNEGSTGFDIIGGTFDVTVAALLRFSHVVNLASTRHPVVSNDPKIPHVPRRHFGVF